ncbi:SpoIIAA family protein [Aquibium oceanicum]|uniref:STAS/SEC14 domain-containing protein n=1 Tax=Aquibium oceanicum TaxID=1670800 RepID=A0A1L3STQ1_9HYPH|nr:STAS/SEC14 domain-containing protein [Aquibium oceanicum]APH72695.1 STAS/SEC14 domain-containing protein [Aquibium oceanicum]
MIVHDNPPHIRRMETGRDDAFGFEITGHITASDIENMFGLLEAAYELHDRIDVLVVVREFEGFDWSAALRKSTLSGKAHALKHIRRYAVVGGPGWMSAAMGFFKPFLSVEMRHFALDEEAEAWAWLDAA